METVARRKIIATIAVVLVLVPLLWGCRTHLKLTEARNREINAYVSAPREMQRNVCLDTSNVLLILPKDMSVTVRDIDTMPPEKPDTIVDSNGSRSVYIMKAVKDENTGEMIANENMNAAIISTNVRNIPERHGKVEVVFDVVVPDKIMDTDWQLRFRPMMWVLEDTLHLEKVYVTGQNFRKKQLKGYQQYEKFLARIITDTTLFVDRRNLEIWLERNLPEVYALRVDSSFVSDEQFASYLMGDGRNSVKFASFYGVTESEAVDFYTSKMKIRSNERLISLKDKKFAKYVKVPIDSVDIRIDTVFTSGNGELVYRYVETIPARPGLRKVDILVDGEIYREGEQIYDMPPSEPLTYYVSSLATLVDPSTRYCTSIVYRRINLTARWHLDFGFNRSNIDLSLGDNRKNLENIRDNISRIVEHTLFGIDSISVTAYASPEGAVSSNAEISRRRGVSVADYVNKYIKHLRDSIYSSGAKMELKDLKFDVGIGGENWAALDEAVMNDKSMTEQEKADYMDIRESKKSLDDCERKLSHRPYYTHLKNDLYPMLRTVVFVFPLYRKNMDKDSVQTNVVDTVYMNGVQAIRDRNYEKAISILGPYRDFNLALALCASDYDSTAMEVLKELSPSPRVKYLLAILYSRNGNENEAVRLYREACDGEPAFKFRGQLDPEISGLLKSIYWRIQDNPQKK